MPCINRLFIVFVSRLRENALVLRLLTLETGDPFERYFTGIVVITDFIIMDLMPRSQFLVLGVALNLLGFFLGQKVG